MKEHELRIKAMELAVAGQGKVSNAEELVSLAERIYQFIVTADKAAEKLASEKAADKAAEKAKK